MFRFELVNFFKDDVWVHGRFLQNQGRLVEAIHLHDWVVKVNILDEIRKNDCIHKHSVVSMIVCCHCWGKLEKLPIVINTYMIGKKYLLACFLICLKLCL